MIISKQVLEHFLSSANVFQLQQQRLILSCEGNSRLHELSPVDLASLYVDAAFLTSAIQFLGEEHWLRQKTFPDTDLSFKDLFQSVENSELSPISYLRPFLSDLNFKDLKVLKQKSSAIENEIVTDIKSRSYDQQKEFSSKALHLMMNLFEWEHALHLEKKTRGLHLGLSMYRTFDSMDKIFNLNYSVDLGMKTDLDGTERLYEGAGVGVQSGYSTVLNALRNLNLSSGARFVDLGSGYGRVGLVVGLMRPDIEFIGYEFVQHRVDIASACSSNLKLSDHVHFYTQDLSLKDFHIPEAEVYYMYDPFSQETYGHVLSQLVEISREKGITIVTKGNARGWLMDVAHQEKWPPPQEFDDGNLCLFQTL